MRQTRCGTTVSIPREIAIPIATIRQLTRITAEAHNICDGNTNYRTCQFCGIYAEDDTANHFDAILLIAMHRRC